MAHPIISVNSFPILLVTSSWLAFCQWSAHSFQQNGWPGRQFLYKANLPSYIYCSEDIFSLSTLSKLREYFGPQVIMASRECMTRNDF